MDTTQTFLAMCFVLSVIGFQNVEGHSYLCEPPSRSKQCDVLRGELVGPCDSATASTNPITASRGEVVTFQWPRNNHPGGYIRWAWAQTELSHDHDAFDEGVVKVSCFESPCNSNNQCDNRLGSHCKPCEDTVEIPLSFQDGEKWTLQWVWYGGGFGLGDYFSCVDYVIQGGPTPTSISSTFTPIFLPGDATSEDSCWTCSTCKTEYRGTDATDLAVVAVVNGSGDGEDGGDSASSDDDSIGEGVDGAGGSSDAGGGQEAEAGNTSADTATGSEESATDDAGSSSACAFCEGRSGVTCYPGNCCTNYINCGPNTCIVQAAAPGTVCYDGALIFATDSRCSGGCELEDTTTTEDNSSEATGEAVGSDEGNTFELLVTSERHLVYQVDTAASTSDTPTLETTLVATLSVVTVVDENEEFGDVECHFESPDLNWSHVGTIDSLTGGRVTPGEIVGECSARIDIQYPADLSTSEQEKYVVEVQAVRTSTDLPIASDEIEITVDWVKDPCALDRGGCSPHATCASSLSLTSDNVYVKKATCTCHSGYVSEMNGVLCYPDPTQPSPSHDSSSSGDSSTSEDSTAGAESDDPSGGGNDDQTANDEGVIDEPNQVNTLELGRDCGAGDGIYCYPSPCCGQFYQCAGGLPYPVQDTAPGTVCANGQLVHIPTKESDLCFGVECAVMSEEEDTPTWCYGTLDNGEQCSLHCGDGKCTHPYEDCQTCSVDCGECSDRSVCGDDECNGDESCAVCSEDCGPCSYEGEPDDEGADETSEETDQSTDQDSDTESDSSTSQQDDSISNDNDAIQEVDHKVSGRVLVGYYTNWSQYRSRGGGLYKFFPEDIDATKFTHLNYAFAKVEDVTYDILPFEWNDVLDYGDGGMYKRFHDHVRSQNPNIKTLISIGGWNFNFFSSTKHIFSDMASTQENREKFIQNAMTFVRGHGFDGLDIDWEYPGVAHQGGRDGDKENFTTLLKEFREAIDDEDTSDGRSPFLLTLAVGAGRSTVDKAYERSEIHKYVDFINLMTYDLRGAWESFTGAHTAMFDETTNNIQSAVQYWIDGGSPSRKLVLGMATYGRSFTLASTTDTSVGAAATGAGRAGTYTGEAGFLSYYEIEEMRQAADSQSFVDEVTGTRVVSRGDQWVSYDDQQTIQLKVALIFDQDLLGGMVWAMDLDDFRSSYPLISAISQGIFAHPSPTALLVPSSILDAEGIWQVLEAEAPELVLSNSVRVVESDDGEHFSVYGVETTQSDAEATLEHVYGLLVNYSHSSSTFSVGGKSSGSEAQKPSQFTLMLVSLVASLALPFALQ